MGGRLSTETLEFVRLLARARVRAEPPWLRGSAAAVWCHRWGSLLACTAARAFALSLLEQRGGLGADGDAPRTHEVLADAHAAGLLA